MAYDTKYLCVPELRWLGAFPSDAEKFYVPKHCLLSLTAEGKHITCQLLALKKVQIKFVGISNFDHYCVAKIIVRQEKNRSHAAQMLSAKGSARMEVIFHLQFLVYFSADSSSTGLR